MAMTITAGIEGTVVVIQQPVATVVQVTGNTGLRGEKGDQGPQGENDLPEFDAHLVAAINTLLDAGIFVVEADGNAEIDGPWTADGGWSLAEYIRYVVADNSGSAPLAFSGYVGTGQVILHNTETRIDYRTTTLNPGNCWDTSWPRFVPTTPGLYQVFACIMYSNSATPSRTIIIKKNSTMVARNANAGTAASEYITVSASALVQLNGIGDYLDFTTLQTSGVSLNLAPGEVNSYFYIYRL